MVDSASTSPVTHTNRLTVLLGDDRTTGGSNWQDTVRHLLSAQGVHLLTAHTGREALSLIETKQVHVAVLDHRMPQLGGLQILKLAREHNKPAPATILLADHLTNTLLHDALSHSVFTVLTKPINHDQLLHAMARAIKRFHQDQWPASH